MPELEADTHGQIVAATASAAGETSLGTITLPAGGPWSIFQIWAYVVNSTPTAAEAITGNFFIRATQGDLDPNPTPSRFPIAETGAALGSTIDRQGVPVSIHNVAWTAPGKSTIEFFLDLDTSLTVAASAIAGVIFGKSLPETVPHQFSDVVNAGISTLAETSIGTITLAEKATKITALCAQLTPDLVQVTAEEILGYIRLDSADVKLTPAQYPFSGVYGAGLGTLIDGASAMPPRWIPVNIPVEGGARIDCYAKLSTAITNAAQAKVFLAYQ